MPSCPSCAAAVSADSRFCSACGAVLDPTGRLGADLDPGPSAAVTATPAPSSSPSRPPSSSGLEGSRFAPGTMLAGRYRIVGLLGRGGMGEVYRAEDLLLGQRVALKFLPEELTGHPDRLQRLLNEVRLARQVSHPNVCRVYDIGEVDGHRFFSMELVEGEDLASLLRQIGRITGEKGADIARQLCAGLAAAHDRGVIHRDLKPANVMIDRSGQVRITDFGLALAGGAEGAEVFAGTPAYMAPEQLAGHEVTERSDLYALGVVLYEMFTGKRPYAAKSVPELRRELEESQPTSPSAHVEDLNPAVERVILRCLEKEPRHRPRSAVAVAAALPGGDPLAAALAAGETPSPGMVAAAGGEGGLTPATASGLAALGLLGFVAVGLLTGQTHLAAYLPLDKPPQVLEERSRQLLAELGHEAPAIQTVTGWWEQPDVYRYVLRELEGPDRWDLLRSGRTPILAFVVRRSPRYLIARPGFTVVKPDDPPLAFSGEARVQLDPQGRLLSLDLLPAQVEGDEAEAVARSAAHLEPTIDWAPLFAAAELDPAAFASVAPRWRPPFDVEARAAWEGEYPELPGVPMRLEAAAAGGRAVFFRAIGPWTHPERMEEAELTRGEKTFRRFFFGISVLALLGAGYLAWRNLRLGRGDRRGASRFAFWFLAAHTLVWALWADHVPNLAEEWQIAERDLGYNLFLAVMLWLLYVGVEPYVRRQWPETLIGWSRLLAGRLRDPRLGRDVLVGIAAGAALALFPALQGTVSGWLGRSAPPPHGFFSSVSFPARIVDVAVHEVLGAMMGTFLLLLFLVLLRRRWLAVGALATLLTVIFTAGAEETLIALPFAAAFAVVVVYVLTRHGLTALVVAFFLNALLDLTPLTTDFGAWYAWQTWLVLAVVAGLVAYGYRTATAGRPLLAGELLEV